MVEKDGKCIDFNCPPGYKEVGPGACTPKCPPLIHLYKMISVLIDVPVVTNYSKIFSAVPRIRFLMKNKKNVSNVLLDRFKVETDV